MKKYILRHKGLLIIALIFGAAFSIGMTLIALILKEVIDIAIARDMNGFITIVLQTLVYIAGLSGCYALYSIFSKKFICKATKVLRGEVFNGILEKNVPDFNAVNSADYLSALTNDVKNVEENYFIPLLLCLENAIIFISSFAVMLYLSPFVLLCLFIAMFFLIIIPSLFQGVIQKRQDDYSKKQSALTVRVKDFLSGFEVIRSYGMGSYTAESFDEKNNDVYNSKYALDKIMATVEALSTTLGVLVQCSVLFVSAYLIITGKITAGALVGLVQISGTIVAPIQVFSENMPKIKGSKLIIERLNGFVNYNDSTFTGTTAPSFQTNISVSELQFSYAEGKQVLNGVEFVFKKGKKYAIVGKSGCGKTTLINLLTGYYAGFNGRILYDGVEMRTIDIEKLNGLSAVIHQNVYMFDESIKDNICLHKGIEESDLNRALSMSGVDMFLDEERSLAAMVGEDGNNLSGGQRQRVAVARALVQGKPLLVLDEGTSAVDMQTAYDIESQLLEIEGLTVITITHSLNAELLNGYDQIIFMDNGRIVETDSFDNLVGAKGGFYDFYHLKHDEQKQGA